MRLFFIGSIHDEDHQPGTGVKAGPEHQPLFDAARQLGHSAASRGHTIVIGSESQNTIDYHLASGALEFATNHPDNTVRLEIHRPNDRKTPYENVPSNVDVVRRFYHEDESSPHKWIVTHVRMLDTCDAVIALGGDTSTRLVGNIAADRQKPLLAVVSFGGASAKLYERLEYLYKFMADPVALQALVLPWQSSFADKAIGLVEALIERASGQSPHLYFLSYCWRDKETADHVEALLRRHNRNVLRDEEHVKSGESLSGAIESLINQSDTFLALWSKDYDGSSWCPNELAYAKDRQHGGKKPRRIVLLKLDDTKTPIRFTDALHRAGASREERFASLLAILQEESMPRRSG